MTYSRLSRVSERTARKKIAVTLLGIFVLLGFFGIFGLKLLIGFSLFVDKLRGGSPTVTNQTVLVQSPVLDPLPIATNSGQLKLTGKAQAGSLVLVYLNDEEFTKLNVPDDGTFSVSDFKFNEGVNSLSAKSMDTNGNVSDLSNVVETNYLKSPPSLEVDQPGQNSTVYGDNPLINISGKTSADVTVTVNQRLALVNSDGSFSLQYRLNEGNNNLKFIATDQAGNQTILERQITYQK